MPKTAEDIIEEVRQNVIRDRGRLEKFLDGVLQDVEGSEDTFAKAAAAESVSKLSDSLTRSNGLLAEMAKLLQKSTPPPRDGWDEDEADGMFDEIGADVSLPENN